MSQFDKLMGELGELATTQETLAKALPADDGKDDEKIQAAAAEGGLDVDKKEDGEGDDGAKDDVDPDAKPFAKSFTLKLDDGTEVEAQDGTELVKSLQAQVETSEGNMLKALGTAVSLIKGQGEMIKSLSDRITKLSGEGRGRKTVLSVVEKPAPGASTLAKSLQPDGMSTDQFFAKAFAAQKDGRISGTDIAVAESCLNRGEAIPASILQRVAQ